MKEAGLEQEPPDGEREPQKHPNPQPVVRSVSTFRDRTAHLRFSLGLHLPASPQDRVRRAWRGPLRRAMRLLSLCWALRTSGFVHSRRRRQPRMYDLLLGNRNFDVMRVLDLSWWPD
jgi:hypothetical protein